MIQNDVQKSKTIKELITKGSVNDLTLENTNIYNQIDNLILAVTNIFIKSYYDIIKFNSINVKFTEDEFKRYRYKPKLFSLVMYNTIEFWHIILWLNNMIDSINFNKTELLLLDPDRSSMLNKIWIKEKIKLINNKETPDFFIKNKELYRR